MAYLKHGLIFCILEGWLSLIRRSFISDNNYSQCCNYPACISININNPFISNDHQIIWRNYNAISDLPRTNMPLFCITETEPSKMRNIRPCVSGRISIMHIPSIKLSMAISLLNIVVQICGIKPLRVI